MDRDDDLILNFAVPTSRHTKNSRGGSQAPAPVRANGIKRHHPPSTAVSTSEAQPTQAKKVRIESSRLAQSSARPSATGHGSLSHSSAAGPSRAKPTTFISSLFSGTPGPIVPIDEDVADASMSRKGAKPTNAPGDTSTFQGLGLHPLLVAHLQSSRMGIGNRPTGIQRAGLPALINGDAGRDVLLHSQTGSGKTLTYMLPILQSLLPLCTETWIDRSVGTLAIILAPTRELARQIYEVAEKLCQLHLSLKEQREEAAGGEKKDDDDEDEDGIRRTRWLVPGLLSGGSTKNHEKSRLRKGIPILIATPGRLLDHLQNTSSFDVGKCRWLVLDEADRLLEMGFKETLEGILKAMDGRRRLAFNTAKETMMEQRGVTSGVLPAEEVEDGTGVKWWVNPRKVVLCSATLDEDVQMLAGTHLRQPQVVRGGGDLAPTSPLQREEKGDTKAQAKLDSSVAGSGSYFRLAAPAQLRQHAVVVPPKLRLVTLIALLRSALSRNAANVDARRIIVFISCTDSVEFYWNALGGVKMGDDSQSSDSVGGKDLEISDNEMSDEDPQDANIPSGQPVPTQSGKAQSRQHKPSRKVEKYCELFPRTPIFRLHGALAQSDRIASLKGFSAGLGKKVNTSHKEGAILFCTSVAARGLDLPSVGCVIQLDPPTEGGPDEYLHRIGRTARVGKDGESWIMFLPHEKEARTRLEATMERVGEVEAAAKEGITSSIIAELEAETILKRGFGGKGDEYEARATEVQLAFERWVMRKEEAAALARRAFLSHIRAYATHPSDEKDLFHIRFLHLGHLAKSFALREAPAMVKNKARGAMLAGAGRSAADSSGSATILNRRDRKREDKAVLGRGEVKVEAHRASNRARLAAKEERSKDDPAAMLAAAINAGRKSRGGVSAEDIMDGIDLSGAAGRGAGAGGGGNKGQSGRNSDAEARMYAKVRMLGRQSKSGGKLAAYGADEFQIA